MTYLQFLLIFLFPPLAFGSWYFFSKKHGDKKLIFRGAWLLVAIAVVYTTPWDNYLVKTEVWGYGADRVLGTIGYVPIEEYAFFVLQTLMTSLWLFFLHTRIPILDSKNGMTGRWLGGALWLAVSLFGVFCLYSQHTTYMGLILAWAAPVALLQWIVGGEYLLRNIKFVFLAIMVPTVYLWIADGIAIALQIWEISATQTIGWKVGSLPIEEAVFFLMTNVMVVFGLTLFVAMKNVISIPYLNAKLDRAEGTST